VHGKASAPQLTRIPERQYAVETAPHRLGATTIRFLANMGDLIDASAAAAARLDLPVAVFSAGHDAFVNPGQIEDFFALIRSPDKTHFHYPESYHQLMFDLDASQVLDAAAAWIEARLA
jgi:alpha-beta hydrolase superfamily lysophospholipase